LLELMRAGRYHGYIGYEVLAEISRAPIRFRQELLDVVGELRPTVLEPTEASARLVEAYFATGSFRRRARVDARHLAIATVAGMDALVSWNYRDMVNLERRRLVQSVNIERGYHMLDIVSPLEVPGVEG
jgi:hypothetical protein